jgi:hypothetical protein
MKRRLIWAGFLLALGCDHANPFATPPSTVGPAQSGSDVRLTFNTDQDFWPIWTEDGKGILYSFVEPGPNVRHRCIGLLPLAGGTRLWQLCDNRAPEADSVSGFPAYALGTGGRLLYVEAVSRGEVSVLSTLWLADTAAPFQRRALISLPTFFDGTMVSWIADLAWTGPNSFIALGQQVIGDQHCLGCILAGAIDTEFVGGIVVRGTISTNTVTLASVAGAVGASAYSLAEGGASIVFTRRDNRRLFRVSAAGGVVDSVATVTTAVGNPFFGGVQLLGVSCRLTSCIVAVAPVLVTRCNGPPDACTVMFGADQTNDHSGIDVGSIELRSVSLVTGDAEVVRTANGKVVMATPQISPTTDEVVVQVGGLWGHLQTFAGSSPADLYLISGIIQ